jgi:hypothetical protein
MKFEKIFKIKNKKNFKKIYFSFFLSFLILFLILILYKNYAIAAITTYCVTEPKTDDDFSLVGTGSGSGQCTSLDFSLYTEGDIFYSIPEDYYYSTSSNFSYYPFGSDLNILPYGEIQDNTPLDQSLSSDVANFVVDMSIYSQGMSYPILGNEGSYSIMRETSVPAGY